MRKIKVALGSSNYEICVGPGLLGRTGRLLLENGFAGKLVVITHPGLQRRYGEALCRTLAGDGFSVSTLLVPEGEAQKTLDTAGRLYQEMSDVFAERTTPVLALGGGVIGDLAGFVAATYLRGVPFIQMPTTLLAQVDSGIGGKVAVDHGRIKNRIGVFYQPSLVIADTDTLKTLPAAELTNGLAEVIKSAAIISREFFSFLEENLGRIIAGEAAVLEEVVFRTAEIKAGVVMEDEQDSGLRNILNFGHTVGHAVESVSGFDMPHGQGVAIGMVAAARISREKGMLDKDGLDRLTGIIEKAGLPVKMPAISIEKVMKAMKHDKKVVRGKIRFVLLESIGRAVITDKISPALVKQVLENEKT